MRGIDPTAIRRHFPVGAEPAEGGYHFRVWAPAQPALSLVLEEPAAEIPMDEDGDGYFAVHVPTATAGMRYRLRLADGNLAPDPVARFQPDGPHGASALVDPTSFDWTDTSWRGIGPGRQVVYEIHVGTFTPAGTWRAAAEELKELANLGITTIEVMPIAEFPGRFNWGYDGVALFAPAHVYGTPDDARFFVDTAHALGLAVILDVVYNHFGPDGCYLPLFGPYLSSRHTTDWGGAINFDDNNAAGVREYFLANAAYWIREFHLDGLRLDATQNIYDESSPHILEEITTHARAAASERTIWIVAENESQDTRLIRSPRVGGYGIDALWNDDFHHSAQVALTGRAEAYYSDHRGSPQEFVSAAKWGFLFQGQFYHWQQQRRGTPSLDIPARAFVNFLQNHDQIANSMDGKRGHQLASLGEWRALTALLLLLPAHAMLFQGQEFSASAPFLFFADHVPELASRVHAGRREFMSQFVSAATASVQERVPDPADEMTFVRSKLDPTEREGHHNTVRMHRDLIRLSRTDPTFAAQDASRLHGAVLADRAFVLRYFGDEGDDRLVLVNLGVDLVLDVVPEPLLAPPSGKHWRLLWSSENPAYGGEGAVEPELDAGWRIPGRATLVLTPRRPIAPT